MALWSPRSSDPVGPNEHIGRRLFDRKRLRGAQDQRVPANFLELYHFEEKRDPGEISVDRLGKTGIDRGVHRYLQSRALYAGSNFNPSRQFLGWAVVQAKQLQNPPSGTPIPKLLVIPSPMDGTADNELTENKYHAHIPRPAHWTYYEMALHLREIFQRNYHLEFPMAEEQANSGAGTSILARVRDWLCSVRAKLG